MADKPTPSKSAPKRRKTTADREMERRVIAAAEKIVDALHKRGIYTVEDLERG